jgi:hypothetical protein
MAPKKERKNKKPFVPKRESTKKGWRFLLKLEGPSKRPKKKLNCIFYFKNVFNFYSLKPLSGSGFREKPAWASSGCTKSGFARLVHGRLSKHGS